jgi:tetratricopeptide (TPR) repeat protein
MKWTYWLLLALALVLVTSGIAMVRRQAKATPEDFFASVAERIESGRYDREQVVQNLDQVLERAQAGGDADLTARVLLLRGRTLRDLGAFEAAKADLLAVAAMRPTDPAVEDDLVDLEARAGDFNAALARVGRMVAIDPAKPHGHVLLGRLHRLAADKALARGRDLLQQSLVSEAFAHASSLLARSAALEPKDPQRIAIAHRLRGILRTADEARLEEVLDIADRAARELEAARDAWAASLARGIETEAVTGLIDLLQRAGRTDLAVDLATVTVRMPAMKADPEFGRTLMRALAELGRWRYAGDVAALWTARTPPVDPEFLLECCAVLWRAGRRSSSGTPPAACGARARRRSARSRTSTPACPRAPSPRCTMPKPPVRTTPRFARARRTTRAGIGRPRASGCSSSPTRSTPIRSRARAPKPGAASRRLRGRSASSCPSAPRSTATSRSSPRETARCGCAWPKSSSPRPTRAGAIPTCISRAG